MRKFGDSVICDHLSLKARPGTITAIMGPSGAGKSVFLKMLCGYDQPSAALAADGQLRPGKITVCNKAGEEAFAYLGYVPQGDAMYPELTTRESLRYRLLLKFGNLLSKQDIDRITKYICGELLNLSIEVKEDHKKKATSDKKEKKVPTIDKKIGTMDSIGSYPSGGERRRINIAHELVLEPRVLILDEPTSGLSSSDSETVMAVLSNLARAKQLTIIMTIHQPSKNMFEQIDDLLLLTRGGKPAYYGPCVKAREWLAPRATFLDPKEQEEIAAMANPAEAVLEYVNQDDAPKCFPPVFLAERNVTTGRITFERREK